MLYNHYNNNSPQVCTESGSSDAWVSAFRLICGPLLTRAPDAATLSTILTRVAEDKLLPSMEIIDLLGSSPHITLGQVRSYLTQLADREEALLAESSAAIADLVTETEAVRRAIRELKNNGLSFTEQNCDACNKDLFFPTVHFFCKHSFHRQ